MGPNQRGSSACKTLFMHCLAAAWFCVGLAQQTGAQRPEQAAGQQRGTSATAPQPAKRDLGQWWLVNPRHIDPLPTEWLFHHEGQFSFNRSTGNVSGYSIASGAVSIIRKGIYNNLLAYNINFQETELSGGRGSFTQDVQIFNEIFSINVAQNTNLLGGLVWEIDEPKFVDFRIAYFGGVSQHLLNDEKHKLYFMVGAGVESENFTVPGFDQDTGVVYLRDDYNWQIAQNVAFNQRFETYLDTANSDDYRMNFSAGFNFQVNRYIGITSDFQLRFDNRPLLQTDKTDTLTMFGIRVTI